MSMRKLCYFQNDGKRQITVDISFHVNSIQSILTPIKYSSTKKFGKEKVTSEFPQNQIRGATFPHVNTSEKLTWGPG